jgi:hypothetical protein
MPKRVMLRVRAEPSGEAGTRTDPAVGKPMERRKRVAVPGGGCPGVRA